ncbi:unnamed protein product [Aureobasidium vineae]|uniref:Uncharacterized protein n=1 Tax=Aureobasidium vineae TaxID=2773715 RepID=A0A9N8PIK3_9PEZI|nr:unnamed protein product [Aureobasidium vineae]
MLHLPEDVQLCVVEQLSTETLTGPEHYNAWNAAIKTLSSLCLTSRRMCMLAQPLLYRGFVRMLKMRMTLDGDNIGVKATEMLELFIRTLLDRPNLANQVWSIRLQELDDGDIDSDEQGFCCDDEYETPEMPDQITRTPDETFLNNCLDSTRRVSAPGADSEDHGWHDVWRSDLAEGKDSAATALLLTLVPNLRHLDIESFKMTYSWHFTMLVKQFFGGASWAKYEKGSEIPSFRFVNSIPLPQKLLPVLSPLERLTFRRDEYRSGWGIELYMCMMYISTLKSFSLIGMSYFFNHPSATYHMPLLKHLRYLRIQNVNSDPIGLFLDTLAKRVDTLERLELVIPFENEHEEDDVHFANRFDLRQLSKLRSSEINQTILFPHSSPENPNFSDLLPTSLESLVVREVDANFATALSNFVEQKDHENPPRLRYIELVETEEFANSTLEENQTAETLEIDHAAWSAVRAELIEMCLDVGIRYKIWSEVAKVFADEKDYKDWPERVKNHFRAGITLSSS